VNATVSAPSTDDQSRKWYSEAEEVWFVKRVFRVPDEIARAARFTVHGIALTEPLLPSQRVYGKLDMGIMPREALTDSYDGMYPTKDCKFLRETERHYHPEFTEDELGLCAANAATINHLVMNLFLYLSNPRELLRQPSLYTQRDAEVNPHRREKIERKIGLTLAADEYLAGQFVIVEKPETLNLPVVTDEESSREVWPHWRRGHWRRGHWRRVWVGPHQDPLRHMEARWIRPVLVNADKGLAPPSAEYFVRQPAGKA